MGLLSKLFGRTPPPEPRRERPAPPPREPETALDPEHLPWRELSPQECQSMIEKGGVVVLDVRLPAEHETRRIEGSKLIPVQALRQRLGELDRGATYLVHCEHGMRSTDACAFLASAGFRNLHEMAGGLSAYAGPTVRGPVR